MYKESSTSPIIYLAGAITGHSFTSANDWREEATGKLESIYGYSTFNPLLAGKDILSQETSLQHSYPHPGFSVGEIFTGCLDAVWNSQCLLVNMKNLKGIGTVFELGYAYGCGVPSVLFNVPEDLQGHPFLRGNDLVSIADSLDSAVEDVYMWILE